MTARLSPSLLAGGVVALVWALCFIVSLCLVACFDSDEGPALELEAIGGECPELPPPPECPEFEPEPPPPDMPEQSPWGTVCIEAATGACAVLQLDECPANWVPACEEP